MTGFEFVLEGWLWIVTVDWEEDDEWVEDGCDDGLKGTEGYIWGERMDERLKKLGDSWKLWLSSSIFSLILSIFAFFVSPSILCLTSEFLEAKDLLLSKILMTVWKFFGLSTLHSPWLFLLYLFPCMLVPLLVMLTLPAETTLLFLPSL